MNAFLSPVCGPLGDVAADGGAGGDAGEQRRDPGDQGGGGGERERARPAGTRPGHGGGGGVGEIRLDRGEQAADDLFGHYPPGEHGEDRGQLGPDQRPHPNPGRGEQARAEDRAGGEPGDGARGEGQVVAPGRDERQGDAGGQRGRGQAEQQPGGCGGGGLGGQDPGPVWG